MQQSAFTVIVEAPDQGEAGRGAQALADRLREAEGVLEVARRKSDPASMDLGTIVQVVATSGAALAIAEGLASWLRARRGVKIVIEGHGPSGSLKAAVEGIDPEAALRIVEQVRQG